MKIHELNGPVAFIGDVHGDLHSVSRQVKKFSPDVKNLIFLGDIGFGFFKDGKLENELLKHIPEHINIWLLRGNHDNPARWDMPNLYPRLNFIKDGDILDINGKRFLAVGGGISIDKIYRTEGVSYWKDEYVRLPDKEVLEDNIFGIISHSGILPPLLEGSPHSLIANGSDELKASIEREKNIFNTILKVAKPKVWIYGHYHVHCFFETEGCHFFNLDINEIFIKVNDDEYPQ